MSFSDNDLIVKVQKGDLRAVARLITLTENNVPRARKVCSELFSKTGKAHVVGVTGSPGAGKSTLVDQLAHEWKKKGKRVAILAVDPTSPFSGGAILGDRIRMTKAIEAEGIFIRSMATRGALGGLSRTTVEVIQILDAAGFDIIIVETVGVGQAEVDIVRTADTCIVVLVPGMGDSVQIIKAGILEIADVFVINKSDRDGADHLEKDLRILMSLSENDEESWKPTINRTVATSGEGTEKVVASVEEHKNWLTSSPKGHNRKLDIIRENIVKIASELLFQEAVIAREDKLKALVKQCFERKKDPYTAAKELIKSDTIQSDIER